MTKISPTAGNGQASATEKRLSSVKVTEEGVNVKYNETLFFDSEDPEQSLKVENKYVVESTHQPHVDLRKALAALRSFALELYETTDDPKQFQVNGITMVYGTTERVIISAQKNLKASGQAVGFAVQAPLDGEQYLHALELSQAVDRLTDEVWAYLGGKHQNAQLKLAV